MIPVPAPWGVKVTKDNNPPVEWTVRRISDQKIEVKIKGKARAILLECPRLNEDDQANLLAVAANYVMGV